MNIQSEIEVRESDEEICIEQVKTKREEIKCRTYRFRMRHFFYIHLVVFILSGLFGGLIIYFIENNSSLKNERMFISYVDAWFISCTCASSCGLTTINFAKLSKISQIILLVITFFSGITVSTIPALAIKAYTHKNVQGITVDNDHGKQVTNSENNRNNSRSRTVKRRLTLELEKEFSLLPTPQQIRYWSYIIIILLIVITCATMYLCYFIILGAWLNTRYSQNGLSEGNFTINPWYASIVIVITGFNQNGLAPFSDGMSRFVNDAYVNILVIMVILSGTSLFPFLLRNIVILSHRLAPWRYKIVFDYILLNDHHLSTLLFPMLQTRIYLFVTFIFYLTAISISLILDLHDSYLSQFSSGTRLLIFIFHSVSARFAGFQTIDISHFASGTLIIYLLLMITKPQMLCALNKSHLELAWISLQTNQKKEEEEEEEEEEVSSIGDSVDNVQTLRKRIPSTSSDTPFLERRVNLYLYRQRMSRKELVRKTKMSVDGNSKGEYVSHLYLQIFFLKFIEAMLKHVMYTLKRLHSWLFIFIFLICAIENKRIDIDPNLTVFKIVFEIISAFGCVGLSLGYPNVSSSFTTVLSPASKVIVGITMIIGRHRGLLASMKDQEQIEHSANQLLDKWKENAIDQYELSFKKETFITRF